MEENFDLIFLTRNPRFPTEGERKANQRTKDQFGIKKKNEISLTTNLMIS